MNDIEKFAVSNRLQALSDWIEEDRFIIDVGTDHAYLPIAIAQIKRCKGILAIDSRAKPLQKARSNVKRAGLEEHIQLLLNDGLKGIPFKGNETIVLSGLGGFLISQILEQRKHDFSTENTFILQPNWTWYELRKWLSENHFRITREKVVRDQEKIYSIIEAVYSKQKFIIDDSEAFIGLNFDQDTLADKKLLKEYYLRLKNIASKRAKGISMYQKIAEDLDQRLRKL